MGNGDALLLRSAIPSTPERVVHIQVTPVSGNPLRAMSRVSGDAT